jgi:flavin reductase (DIM6/NTAB) family NADH-FMN oxidoreductase RutF
MRWSSRLFSLLIETGDSAISFTLHIMRKFKAYGKDDLDQKTRHGLLLGGIGPRPIAWVSTVDTEGNVNLAPFSFFNLFSSNPPVLIFSPARKGRDNTIKHTLENLEKIPECVVNVVPYSLMQQMVLSSLEYPKGVDEFEKAGLKKLESLDVKPPRVAESPMQLECKLIEIKKLGDQGGAGNLMICEVLRIHIADDVLDEKGWIDPHKIDLIGRMGGAWYSRANGNAIFQVKSDVSVTGVGFDFLPPEARTSKVLTGNELGILASLQAIPDETQVNDFKLEILSDIFMDFQDSPEELLEALHRKASGFIREGKLTEGWMCLLSYNS